MPVDLVTPILVSLIIAGISLVLSELLRPKPDIENARPSGVDDFKFPTAQEDRVVPILFGTVKVSGPNVVWYGDFQQAAQKETIRTGLWSKTRIVTGFRYYFGFQMALCRGEWAGIRRAWVGESEVLPASGGFRASGEETIDEPSLFGGDKQGNGGIQGTLIIHEGSETQAIDTYLATQQGATTTPAYRGTCYVVWRGPSGTPLAAAFRDGWIGNSTQISPWAFECGRFPNGLGIGGGRHIINTLDANPMAVVYELLTNEEWGFGFDPSTIDTATMLTAADTLESEGNGFSFLMDRQMEAIDLLQELERQMDGIVFFDRKSGQWTVNLTRGGYDLDLITQVDATKGTGNVIEVRDFTRGTWDETVNQLRVRFSDRSRDYENTFVMSPDLGNNRIQRNEIVSTSMTFPGIKDKALAAEISARELKALSIPLAKANVVVDRTLYDIAPGDPVAYTDPLLGLVKFPMRAMGIDFGDLENNQISLTLIQDVFVKATQIVAPPFDPLWVPPTQDVTAFPAAQQVAFVAPYALVRRDPDNPELLSRIWGSGRRQTGAETNFKMYKKATGDASFIEAGDVDQFMLIGTLGSDLIKTTENPVLQGITSGSLGIVPTYSTKAEIFAALVNTNASDAGGNLTNLLLIDDEFFLPFDKITDQPGGVDCGDFYRGVLDSAPADHSAGANVYVLFAGGGLSDIAIAGGLTDVQLRPESRTDVVTEGEATSITLSSNVKRDRDPYPPHAMFINGEFFRGTHPVAPTPGQVDIDIVKPPGSSPDLRDKGIVVVFLRRDWRTFDEVVGVGTFVAPGSEGADATVVITDAADFSPVPFPSTDNTQYRLEATGLSAFAPNITVDWNSGENEIFIRRTRFINADQGIATPYEIRFEIRTRHTVNGEIREATEKLTWDFYYKSSTLANDVALGNLSNGEISAIYGVTQTGTMTATLEEVLAADVEVRLNGGAWTTLISAGNATGTVGVTVGDDLEVRHLDPAPPAPDNVAAIFLQLDFPSVSSNGYAVLVP